MVKIVPVILCGGSGSRLWPLSRRGYPKQLLRLNGTDSLLQQTVLRLVGLSEITSPLIICNEEHRFHVAAQLQEVGFGSVPIVLEPQGRNTAPAATLAALYAGQHFGGDALLLLLPADHLLGDIAAFHDAVSSARDVAQQGYLVAFGVRADRPETAYGYIHTSPPVVARDIGSAMLISGFVEKPDRQTAAEYLASGCALWNSGIFLMKSDVLLAEMDIHAPVISSACRDAFAHAQLDHDFLRVDRDIFFTCPADSLDYAIMEKTARGAVVALGSTWSDVGSWKTLWEVGTQDSNGNVLRGDVFTRDTSGCYIHATDRLVATVGLTDQVIVETADAVLVAGREHVQDVRLIVAALEKQGRREINLHRCVHRPWGYYETIAVGQRFQVKLIQVKPGAALSLQMHHHRAEHWVVVRGTAQVTCGARTFMVSENESTFIPLGTRHRLANPGVIPLELIEIQSGSYLEEDDIIRFSEEDQFSGPVE